MYKCSNIPHLEYSRIFGTSTPTVANLESVQLEKKTYHSPAHAYILMGWFLLTLTGARMVSQRQPKQLHRTHKTGTVCHLRGPKKWKCRAAGVKLFRPETCISRYSILDI